MAAKLNRPPELVVFEKVSEDGNCSECGAELAQARYDSDTPAVPRMKLA